MPDAAQPISGTITWSTAPASEPDAPKGGVTKMTVNLPEDVIEDSKRAFWMDRDESATFAAWVADALTTKIADTKRRHGLDTLPERPRRLPTGRPLS